MLTCCAVVSVPTGGDIDITPPEIIETSPDNFTRNFSQQEIVITFDEYVELKNFSQQFSISPPLENKIDQLLKGKKLYLTIKDSLVENTTYTLSFGNSIVDISEGNPQTTFKYVFSTGDIIDSLSVQGYVHNALRGNPIEGVLAMLYPEGEDDSAAYLSKPRYYTTTSEDGFFSIDHIANGNYRLLVVDDKDFNFRLSGKGEKLGFLDSLINPIADTLYYIPLFREKNNLTFVQAKQSGYGKATIYYSSELPASAEFKNADNSPLWVNFTARKDTFDIWFEETDTDSLLIYATYENTLDTIFIRKTEKEKPKVILKEMNKVVTPNQFMVLECNAPVIKLDPTKWIFVDNEDTIATPPIKILDNKLQIEITLKPEFGHKYKVFLYHGFAETFFSNYSDTLALEFIAKLERNYAYYILDLKRKTSNQYIVQLLDEKGKLLNEYLIKGSKKIEMPYLLPGKYLLRLIEDENENGVWDTGNYWQKKQPEKVIYYPDPIELRANWEIETIWEMDSKTGQ